jgi:hypothetical protein
VVGVAAAMVAHCAALGFGHRLQIPDQFFHGFAGERGAVDRFVELVDVGLVMFGVVDLHRLRVDMRFERVVGVRKFRKRVGHGITPSEEGRRIAGCAFARPS